MKSRTPCGEKNNRGNIYEIQLEEEEREAKCIWRTNKLDGPEIKWTISSAARKRLSMCNMYVTLQSVAVGILQWTRVQYNESNLSWGLQVQFHEAHQPILKKNCTSYQYQHGVSSSDGVLTSTLGNFTLNGSLYKSAFKQGIECGGWMMT